MTVYFGSSIAMADPVKNKTNAPENSRVIILSSPMNISIKTIIP